MIPSKLYETILNIMSQCYLIMFPRLSSINDQGLTRIKHDY
jgi:hypothetical protein